MSIDDRGSQIQGIALFFIILSWLCVSARCYVKIFMTGLFGFEDWLALLNLVVFTLFSAFNLIGVATGIGRHTSTLTIEEYVAAGKWYYCIELLYAISAALIKICIAVLLLRICERKSHKVVIWVVISTVTIVTIFYFFLLAFQCSPVSFFWTRPTGSGTCLPIAVTTNSTYGYAAISALADWTLCILPIFLVKDLQMNFRNKVSVAMILSLGALGSTATIVRIPYIYHVTIDPDWLYNITDICIWSIVEIGTGTVASSLATLRPLVRAFLSRSKQLGSSTPAAHAGPSANSWTASRAGYLRSGVGTRKGGDDPYENGKKSAVHVTTVVQTTSTFKNGSSSDGDIELGQQRVITGNAHSGKSRWNNSTDKLANSSTETVDVEVAGHQRG